MKLTLSPSLAIQQWTDTFGSFDSQADEQSVLQPSLRLVRHDDAWRPLADRPAAIRKDGTRTVAEWDDQYGGERPYCRPKDLVFPKYWPAALDAWPYPDDFHAHCVMPFSGRMTAEPVETPRGTGTRFTVRITDQRDPAESWPQQVIKLPVGIEMPLSPQARVYGGQDLYFDHRQIDMRLDDPELPRKWYYLEAELFGLRSPSPHLDESADPGRPKNEIHCSAPFTACSEDGRLWWGIASEPDYGAALFWGKDRVRLFSTLYLEPGGTAEWSFVVWRQETDKPQELLLEAARTDGFFNHLNPLGFTPKGAPEGPIVFECISRIQHEWKELEALKPGLVILNFHYDHISSTANLYGSWKTYEGFQLTEHELKDLIKRIRSLGAKVGFYGSVVEQAVSHKIVDDSDFLLDPWGRRWHAWEPGNWVIDAGNRNAADRYAKSEAELAQYYGIDAIFIDRLDYLGINHNPDRVGEGDAEGRLKLIPSVRLGMIELNRARIRWQRKLNPDLYIGLNNTTCWAGVRYSDFNLLEGGDEMEDQALPWLHQPNGVVNLRHFSMLFVDPIKTTDLFQTIGGHDLKHKTFVDTLRAFMRNSLISGIIPEPYGDEFFVDPKSMFFDPDHDKTKPDEEKHAMLAAYTYYGGHQWRIWWDEIEPVLKAAEDLATPVQSITSTPDSGPLPFKHRFLARRGAKGLYIGLINESDEAQSVSLTTFDTPVEAELPPGHVLAAWKADEGELTSMVW